MNFKGLNKILLFYKTSSFRCEDTATDKQPVNESIVEKLRSKPNFRWLKQFSVFLRISVNVMSFNNLHVVKMRIRGLPVHVHKFFYYFRCFTPFSRIARAKYVFSNCC